MLYSSELLGYLSSGVLLGLSAGISPGPLLTLVISETITHGIRAGIKVAAAPLITDGPIIVVSLFILSRMSNADMLLGFISIVGAVFVGYLGIESMRTQVINIDIKTVKSKSLTKGILTNALSPHPYIFWFSVGGPYMVQGYKANPMSPAAFIIGFLALLVISKIAIALITERSSAFIKSAKYIYLVRALGFALLVFAVFLLRDGLALLR